MEKEKANGGEEEEMEEKGEKEESTFIRSIFSSSLCYSTNIYRASLVSRIAQRHSEIVSQKKSPPLVKSCLFRGR